MKKGAKGWWQFLLVLGSVATILFYSGGCVSRNQTSETSAVEAQCTDQPPDQKYSCRDQAAWKKCSQPFMAGFCNKSCGRCGGAPAATGSTCGIANPTEMERPWVGYPRTQDYDWMKITEWCQRFQNNLADRARAQAKLAFIGDSITQGWTDRASDVWQSHFGKYQPLRLGIGGDKTQNVIWRMQHGELKGLNLKAVVLLIGTNNLGWGDTPRDVVYGVKAVIETIKKEQPQAKIIQMAIFPREQQASHPMRGKIAETNRLLKEQAGALGVTLLDIGSSFLDREGAIPQSLMQDFLHPTHAGYKMWAGALDSVLSQAMK
jgi:lysophospholipase L1-like esterase